jgi:hypothetical protein
MLQPQGSPVSNEGYSWSVTAAAGPGCVGCVCFGYWNEVWQLRSFGYWNEVWQLRWWSSHPRIYGHARWRWREVECLHELGVWHALILEAGRRVAWGILEKEGKRPLEPP